MNEINVDKLLLQMRAMADKARNLEVTPPADGVRTEFSSLLKQSVEQVNDAQKIAGELAGRFELGDKSVSMADVMVGLQKANISFQAMTQVRNKLVSAYQEIMNMPI